MHTGHASGDGRSGYQRHDTSSCIDPGNRTTGIVEDDDRQERWMN
jgi:hypothetical protein